MERIVRDITEKMTAQLPGDRKFYTPDDIQVLDIPAFISDRVIIEMYQNLKESVTPPETEWAKMDGESVRFAWKNFLEAIRAEVRMPASYAAPLFETAVEDALELATQPRKSIPQILYGADQTLSVESLKKRIRYITIGKPLAAALIRYMEKKNKQELGVGQCEAIIQKIDERLVQGYNALDWAKELDPLFNLAGPKVDPELFRVYFEDKALHRYARLFDRINRSLNRTEFIEVISSPEVISDGEDLPGESSLLDEAPKKKSPLEGPGPERQSGFSIGSNHKHTSNSSEDSKEDELANDSILAAFQQGRGVRDEDDVSEEEPVSPIHHEDDSDEESLLSRFVMDEEDAEEPEKNIAETGDDDSDDMTIYDEMNLKKGASSKRLKDILAPDEDVDDPDEFEHDLLRKWQAIGGAGEQNESDKEDRSKAEEPVETDEDLAETDKPNDSDDVGVTSVETYNEEDDVPIWRAFLDREDLSRVADEGDEDSEEEYSLGSYASDHGVGGTEDDEAKLNQMLEKWVSDEKERFVNEIFKGSENAYEDALEGVLEYDDWKNASRYLQNDIFNRNRVDVFDEAAVDFTDRLHTFFLEYKS
jgi:hypothetical protein